jgi:muramidase (phage lysozyme)
MTPNVKAFLTMLAHSEGVDRPPAPPDPYRCCYAYKHVIIDLTYHPHQLRPDGTREWGGERLSDAQCAALGLHPGCVSTAAGRYQITWGTFDRLQGKIGVRDFNWPSQDDCAIELVKEVGALSLINAGNIADAIPLCKHLWASLPGNTSGQPQSKLVDLMHAYGNAGGILA